MTRQFIVFCAWVFVFSIEIGTIMKKDIMTFKNQETLQQHSINSFDNIFHFFSSPQWGPFIAP